MTSPLPPTPLPLQISFQSELAGVLRIKSGVEAALEEAGGEMETLKEANRELQVDAMVWWA